MLNHIILSLINSQAVTPKAMETDDLESPASYEGWIYPLRYLLSIRYLKIKKNLLEEFREQKVYPVPEMDFKEKLIAKLAGKGSNKQIKKAPLSAIGFKSLLVYPALLAALLFGLFQLESWYKNHKVENVLANHLPYFSDLLHRKLLLTHNDNSEFITKIDAAIEEQKQKILADLPEDDGIRPLMETQLDKLKDSTVSSEDIMLGFKDMNTLFDSKGLPFYLTPKSFSMPCSSLIDATVEEMMMLKKLEELMSNNDPQRCRTTMMTAYKVNQRDRLMYSEKDQPEVELPLFQVERIDKVPAVDSALGLTFKDRGIGSIILNDRIEKFAEESILPAMTFQGRNYIIPYWMYGYYEIEEAITKAYKKDLEMIYPNKTERLKVKKLVKQLIKDKTRMQNAKMQQTLERTSSNSETNIFGSGFDAISVLLGKIGQTDDKKKKTKPIKKPESLNKNLDLLTKLNDVLLPSIEYHEAYHQIKKEHWKVPGWQKEAFKDKLTENGIDHTMEELGAYLAQLANTEQGHNIWISKLLIFSLNPMTKGQAEYYASSIIFTTLESLYLGASIKPNFDADVDKKTEIFKVLTTMDRKEIRKLARRAYEALFEREVPILR